ncbi:hypothetical protein [Rhizobium hidalgonense]|uniref:Uncharacterized protein n=1 Tax=Rhizobium hidalgonense TaxID=1538159 RepID=A0ABX4JRW5_9HYPH|nr:hypothetical protein [Rhizobium hidalgonense]PDT22321.1 hypothetical protein CO674_17160 [Rhizobium hidalgonense]PON08983.1 hypothetical protein ATY29_02920 [Rhizobium hidalgonense]
MFDQIEDVKDYLADGELDQVRRKNEGGRSNLVGHQYEVAYASIEVLRLAAQMVMASLDPDKTKIAAQLRASFVDDFAIIERGVFWWFEMKAGKDVRWDKKQSKTARSIEENFRSMINIDNRRRRKAFYRLVVADADAADNLVVSCPDGLEEVEVIHFPWALIPRDVEALFPDFQEWVRWILPARKAETFKGLELYPIEASYGEAEANAALRQFRGFVFDMRPATTYSIREAFKEIDRACLGLFGWETDDLDAEVASILDQIPNFQFVTFNGQLNYVLYERITGSVPARLGADSGRRFESAVRQLKPRTVDALKPILRGKYGP